MPKKKTIDIGRLGAEFQEDILRQVKEAQELLLHNDAEIFTKEVEAYYALKAQLEKQVEKALSGRDGCMLDKANFSIAKKLKVIASLPPKKPTTPAGYIKAHVAIVTGKVGARKRAPKEDTAIIVETKAGEVKARKLAPKKKAATKKKAAKKKAPAKKA